MSRKDPVTDEVYRAVMRRDGDCIAASNHHLVRRLYLNHPYPAETRCEGRLTLQHVKDAPRMGKRAPSDVRHLVVLCERHHLWESWATNRGALAFQRDYLWNVNELMGSSSTEILGGGIR